jgi:hypothetical protein
MGDFAVDSDTLPTAPILPNPSSSNASSDVSKQPSQRAADAWYLTLNAAKLAAPSSNFAWHRVTRSHRHQRSTRRKSRTPHLSGAQELSWGPSITVLVHPKRVLLQYAIHPASSPRFGFVD